MYRNTNKALDIFYFIYWASEERAASYKNKKYTYLHSLLISTSHFQLQMLKVSNYEIAKASK